MKAPAIAEILKACQAEQATVVVFFPGGKSEGIVTRVDDDLVELRPVHGSSRTVVVLTQILAVTRD